MSFDGDLYPEAGASKVITSKGDLVRGNASGDRERYGIGSTNQILSVSSGNILWKTLTTADSTLTTQGDVLVEGASGLERLGQSTNFYTLATKGSGANPAWQASATSTMTAAQDILYSSSANTLARLAAGADGKVLTTHSTGSAPTWETPSAGGSWELLDETSVDNSTTGTTHTFSFSPSLDMMDGGDYNALYCLGKGRFDTQVSLQCKLNAQTEYHSQYTQNLSGTVTGVSDTSATEFEVVDSAIVATVGSFPFAFGFYITQQYGKSTGDQEALYYYGFGNSNLGFSTFRGNTAALANGDVSSIEFKVSSGNYTGTDFRIYGIKST
jgi:hypothetical protein